MTRHSMYYIVKQCYGCIVTNPYITLSPSGHCGDLRNQCPFQAMKVAACHLNSSEGSKGSTDLFVTSLHDGDTGPRDMSYHEPRYDYASDKMRAVLGGLKDTLGARVVARLQSNRTGGPTSRLRNLLFLCSSLEWPSKMKNCTTDGLEELSKRYGLLDLLCQVAKTQHPLRRECPARNWTPVALANWIYQIAKAIELIVSWNFPWL